MFFKSRFLMGITATGLLLAGLAIGVYALGTSGKFEPGAGTSVAERSNVSPAPKADSGWLHEYTLTERSGRTFRSQDLKGEVHVVNFFFTACPTTCRQQTAAVQTLAREFGPQGVKFLSITCDPDTDNPVQLALYARQFEADPEHWLFLTGELPYLRRVGAEVYFLPVDRATHSEALLVLGRDGKIRRRVNWKQDQEMADMRKMLTELLAEPVSG